jgi:hypothetical protein
MMTLTLANSRELVFYAYKIVEAALLGEQVLLPSNHDNPEVGVAIFISKDGRFVRWSAEFTKTRLSAMFGWHVLRAVGLEEMG